MMMMMMMGVLLKLPAISYPLSLKHQLNPFHSTATITTRTTTMALSRSSSSSSTHRYNTISSSSNKVVGPILLFDIMDTVVRDPFYHDVPAFFRMSFDELIECKHPMAWIEFEKGLIDEAELARTFFKDGRPLDMEGLKNCMRKGYSYVEGIEDLLHVLKHNNYEMHAFTNYPIWYEMIEDKLNISKYLSWTFCSCITGKRKPDPEFFLEVVKHLRVDPANCIFVDDRMRNVEAAKEIGIIGLHFKNADLLRQDLSLLGISISTNQTNLAQE